jgi:hypothetical protein
MQDGERMTDRVSPESRAPPGRAGRWLAAALALAALAGCEHGDLSFDSSTGQFRIPLGAGSGQGSNR